MPAIDLPHEVHDLRSGHAFGAWYPQRLCQSCNVLLGAFLKLIHAAINHKSQYTLKHLVVRGFAGHERVTKDGVQGWCVGPAARYSPRCLHSDKPLVSGHWLQSAWVLVVCVLILGVFGALAVEPSIPDPEGSGARSP